MKKSKFLKPFSFASLALLMGIAGTMAFAPLGVGTQGSTLANASEIETTTSGLGLDPKNDPVVYTTESGLEIKKSNGKYTTTTTTTTNKGKSYTQDLTGFYYFTMGTFSGTIYTGKTKTDTYEVSNEPVNWIILGVDSTIFVNSVSKYLFSTIKNWRDLFSDGIYFFDNHYETNSPAGQLIDSTVSVKTYIMDKIEASIPRDPADEIPEGCMLVISEKILGNMYFNSKGNLNYGIAGLSSNCSYLYGEGSSFYGGRYRYFGNIASNTATQTWTITGNPGGSLYNYINNLFSKNNSTGAIEGNNNLGFTQSQANLIVPQQLYTYYYSGSAHLQETPSSDGNTYYSMFPLAYRAARSSTYQNFCIEDYLTTTTQKVAAFIGSNQCYKWWLRSGYDYDPGEGRYFSSLTCFVDCDSAIKDQNCNGSHGVRPAMVVKIQ